jgi:hypothetical protein
MIILLADVKEIVRAVRSRPKLSRLLRSRLAAVDCRKLTGDINHCLTAYGVRLGLPTPEVLAEARDLLELLKSGQLQRWLHNLEIFDAAPLRCRIEEALAREQHTAVGYHKRITAMRRATGEISEKELRALEKSATDIRPLDQLIGVDLARVWRWHFESPTGRRYNAKRKSAAPFISFVQKVLTEARIPNEPLSAARIADIIKMRGRV